MPAGHVLPLARACLRLVFASYMRMKACRASRLGLLEEIVDPRHDDVRAYPLLTGAQSAIYGRGLLADGLWLYP